MLNTLTLILLLCAEAPSPPVSTGATTRTTEAPRGAPSAAALNVRRFGAAGDGRTKDTAAIQRAIDAAARAGGGTVNLPPGTYLSGTLLLRSRVTLDIAPAAVLLASTDLEDYPRKLPAFRSYADNYADQSLLYGESVEDVALVGGGTIDGRGASFQNPSYKERPYLLRLVASRRIRVESLTFKDSAMWVQHYLACEQLAIRGVRVRSRCNRNNDGLDIDGCRNVTVSDCDISSGDDAVVLKSTANVPCENVAISNCVLSSACNGIKLGTESTGGFRQITVTNCTLYDVNLAGLALETVDGGTLEGVTVSNLVMRNVKVPLFLRLGNRARPFLADGDKPGVGRMRGIIISNVVAAGAGPIGCAIAGIPGHPIEDVTLRDIRLHFAGGGTPEQAERTIPELPADYPESTMFGPLPAYGLYARHVRGLAIHNLSVHCESPDARPALVCDDAANLRVTDLDADPPKSAHPLIRLDNVRRALLTGCTAPDQTGLFLRLGPDSRDVSVLACDLSRADMAFHDASSPTALHQSANRLKE